MTRHCVDNSMIDYIMNSYVGATTTISCGPNKIPGVDLLRGVKQGDPLSPILFNLVLDELFALLPDWIGAKIDNVFVNALAFADDIVLLAETVNGMKSLLTIMENFFDKRSMRVNAGKCFSMQFLLGKKGRQTVVARESAFNIGGTSLATCGYDKAFKYLGIKYDPRGKMKPTLDSYKAMLNRVAKAPLKPQQKLVLLRDNVMPKFLHELVLGRVTKGLLESFDQHTRSTIRSVLRLPGDTPVHFFHAPIAAGGLAVTMLSESVPRYILRRIRNLTKSTDPAVCDLFQAESTRNLEQKCLRMIGMNTVNEALCYTMRQKTGNLYNTIDGRSLQEFPKNHGGQGWLTYAPKHITGKNYSNRIRLRIGKLPTLENCNRGREADKKCRKCKQYNESVTHILSRCHHNHFSRIQRHNFVAKLFVKACETAGCRVLWEEHILVNGNVYKPDLLIIKNDKV